MQRILPLLVAMLLVTACLPSPRNQTMPARQIPTAAPTQAAPPFATPAAVVADDPAAAMPTSAMLAAAPTVQPAAPMAIQIATTRQLAAANAPPALPLGADLVTAIRDVSRRARPAVVYVSVRISSSTDLLQPGPSEGVGSGAIYDPSGLVITNNHVVEGAEQITVILPDGRSFEGRLVGRDPNTDLAVIKIDGDNLPTIPFGDSDALEVGEWVVAIGNALGLEGGPTLTAGVVGALGRTIQEPNGAILQDLIQTDAAINPGNSGGPLVNLNGEIVGINTAGAFLQQGVPAAGLGFAISINSAKPIVAELAATGRIRRAFLGVAAVTLNPAIVSQENLTVEEGVIFARVESGGPAARAGIRELDVMVSLDGRPIRDLRDLRNVLGTLSPGDVVSAEIVRGAERREVTITLGEAPAPE